MLKAFVTSSFALAALCTGAVIFVACSDSSSSEFEGPRDPDATDGPISSLVPEGGGPDSGEGGATSCTASKPNPFTPTWKVPTPAPSACSAADLKKYWDSCLANPGMTEGDGTCAKFKTDFPTCAACAEPTDNAGPIQWHLSRKFYTVNVAGCIEVTQSADGGASTGCGEAYNAAVQCSRESCLTCITQVGSFQAFTTCQQQAGSNVCKSFEDAKNAPCTGYKNPGSPALPCFNGGTASETPEVVFTRIVGKFCGPP